MGDAGFYGRNMQYILEILVHLSQKGKNGPVVFGRQVWFSGPLRVVPPRAAFGRFPKLMVAYKCNAQEDALWNLIWPKSCLVLFSRPKIHDRKMTSKTQPEMVSFRVSPGVHHQRTTVFPALGLLAEWKHGNPLERRDQGSVSLQYWEPWTHQKHC